jgi:hypothetical protein
MRVEVAIQPQGMKAQLYSASGQVLYAPDLVVQSPPTPVQTPTLVNQPAMIRVWVSEALGETGGTCDVVLLKGGIQLDIVQAVSVPAGKPFGKKVEVVLHAQFSAASTYDLDVKIQNSNPSEYDDGNGSNNLTKVTILVEAAVPAADPIASSMSYFFTSSRDCILEEAYDPSGTTLLRTTTDRATDTLADSFFYQVRLSYPVTAAGFRVNVWSDDGVNPLSQVNRMLAYIPVSRPTSTKPIQPQPGDTVFMDWFYSLTPDGSDRISMSSVLLPDGTGSAGFSVLHDGSEHHYFSARLFFEQAQVIYSGEDFFGTVWGAKSYVAADIRFIDLPGPFLQEHGGPVQATLSSSSQDFPYVPPPEEFFDPSSNTLYRTRRQSHSDTWSGSGAGGS